MKGGNGVVFYSPLPFPYSLLERSEDNGDFEGEEAREDSGAGQGA